MATRRPLVNVSGALQELPAGDTLASAFARVVVSTAAAVTLANAANTDYIYMVTGAHNLTMPASNTNTYVVKNNHTANITIDATNPVLIEKVASITISPESSVTIVSNGTDWFVI